MNNQLYFMIIIQYCDFSFKDIVGTTVEINLFVKRKRCMIRQRNKGNCFETDFHT